MTRESNNMPAEETGGDFGLREILGMLRRRVWVILGLALLGTAIAFAVTRILPNQYESVATIQIDPRKKTVIHLDAVLPDIAGDTPSIESQVELLRSKAIAQRVIEVLDLRNDPEFSLPSMPERIWRRIRPSTLLGFAKKAAEPVVQVLAPQAPSSFMGPESLGTLKPERDEVAAAFAARLKAQRVRNTLIVEVRFTSEDPIKSARITQTIAEVYIRDQIDMKVRATGLVAELLEQKLGGLRQKVSDSERKIAAFKADNNIFDVEGQILSEKQLARLMEQAVVARNNTAETKARYEQLQRMLKDGEGKAVADVLQSHTVRMLKDQYVKATRHEAELQTKYGPLHPEMAKVKAEVADIQGQLTHEIDQIVANLKNEYRVAEDREKTLATSLAGLKDQQNLSKEVSVRLRELEREATSSRQVFETFLARHKQTTETQDLQIPDARIVEQAGIPVYPISPKKKQIMIVGILAGLVLGLGAGLLLELSTPGLMRPEDVETLGVPHLGSIPLLKRQSDGLNDPVQSARAVITHPNGAFAGTIRELLMAIDVRRQDSTPRIILVASALPTEGKTLVASNLAHQLAITGVKTLLIDADMHRSVLSQQLGLETAPGLLDAIARGQAFEGGIVRDQTTGLAVLAAGGGGRIPLSPAEALGAPGIGQRLARLKTYFDTIIIDAPPLLPVVDARIIADFADHIVMVSFWRKTPKALVRRAFRLLATNADKIVGVAINQIDPVAHAEILAERKAKALKRSNPPRKAA